MSYKVGPYLEAKQTVENIVKVLDVSEYAQRTAAGIVPLNLNNNNPLLKNHYTIADTYTYNIAILVYMLSSSSGVTEAQVESATTELIFCFSKILQHYHHVPLDIFSKTMENRFTVYSEILSTETDMRSVYTKLTTAFYKIIRYEFYTEEYCNIFRKEIPTVNTDFIVTLSQDQTIRDYVNIRSDQIAAVHYLDENWHRYYSRKPNVPPFPLKSTIRECINFRMPKVTNTNNDDSEESDAYTSSVSSFMKNTANSPGQDSEKTKSAPHKCTPYKALFFILLFVYLITIAYFVFPSLIK